VGLGIDPTGREPIRETRKVRVGDIDEHRRLVRDGFQLLDHGALVCPSCNVPVVIDTPVPISRDLRCGFCDHEARVGEFVSANVFDTVPNEVYVVARVV
jgi:hypothetical protein